MRRSPVVLGIVAGLLAGAGGAAAVALSGGDAPRHRLVVADTQNPSSAGRSVPLGGREVDVFVKGHLPALDGEARAYRLGSEPPTSSIETLAAAFGVHGPVQSDAGGWIVREGKRLVRVQRTPGLSWFFTALNGPCQIVPASPGSAPPAAPNQPTPEPQPEPLQTIPPTGATDCPVEGGVASSGVAIACPADQPCPTLTTQPPMALDPEPIAVRALMEAGLGDHYAVLTSKGPTSGIVTVSPTVDHRPVSGLDWSATVSANGEVTGASGFLAQPEPAVSYKLIGTTAGLERLKAATPLPMLGRPDCAPEGDCTIPPLPRRVVTNVRLGLIRGSAYLIPAYLFEFEGGGVQAVAAVPDSAIEVPSAPVTDGKPVPAPR
jgi:hypothetical protein